MIIIPKILVTGSLGQIGTELIIQLRNQYGSENVIATDIIEHPPLSLKDGPYEILDVTDKERFDQIISDYQINWLVHNASILSATGERRPQLVMDVNIRGFENAIELAKKYQLRILTPSSIAAFGPSTPKDQTPDITIMRPTTIYGISKLYLEVLGEYYNNKWGVDFRSIRYPGIISWKSPPGGGTTDYAIQIFHEALNNKKYTSFLGSDTVLPMMHMEDCLNGTLQLLAADDTNFTQRTFNLAAISFNPQQLADEIKKHIPEFEINYELDYRQDIAENWPRSLDDHEARKQWGWKHEYDLEKLVVNMLTNLSKKLQIPFENIIQ